MKILVIDTSCKTSMAALTENGNVISSIALNDNKTHSVKMLPSIEYILDASGVDPKELEAIAVTNGPGSYTGLRIGVTTAKTFAYTLQIPLVGINTLDALAASCEPQSDDTLVCPLIDARNARVYAAIYKNGNILQETQALDCAELCENLKEIESAKILFTGDGAVSNKKLIADILGERAVFVPTEMSLGSPAALAYVASKRIDEIIQNGTISDYTAESLKVNYYKNYTDSI